MPRAINRTGAAVALHIALAIAIIAHQVIAPRAVPVVSTVLFLVAFGPSECLQQFAAVVALVCCYLSAHPRPLIGISAHVVPDFG